MIAKTMVTTTAATIAGITISVTIHIMCTPLFVGYFLMPLLQSLYFVSILRLGKHTEAGCTWDIVGLLDGFANKSAIARLNELNEAREVIRITEVNICGNKDHESVTLACYKAKNYYISFIS